MYRKTFTSIRYMMEELTNCYFPTVVCRRLKHNTDNHTLLEGSELHIDTHATSKRTTCAKVFMPQNPQTGIPEKNHTTRPKSYKANITKNMSKCHRLKFMPSNFLTPLMLSTLCKQYATKKNPIMARMMRRMKEKWRPFERMMRTDTAESSMRMR